ncbi:MAG: CbtA family protein [Janthinobacterium lividum]
MTRSLLIRGMIAGLVAGLLLFAVGRSLGEPQVDRAIAYETAMDAARAQADAAAGHAPALPEPELVSRSNQAGLGLLTGTVVYGAAFGGLFALCFAFAHGRLGVADPRGLALLLAAGGFLAVFLVPDLKYPSNPPSVGEPGTIGLRTALYFAMMAGSVAALLAATALRQRLLPARGAWAATLLAAAFYAACVAVAMLLLPAVQEVPDGFDAVLLWRFRMATIAMQFTMWATLGLLFGALAERLFSGTRRVPGAVWQQAATR